MLTFTMFLNAQISDPLFTPFHFQLTSGNVKKTFPQNSLEHWIAENETLGDWFYL